MRTILSSFVAAAVLMSAGAALAESDKALQALTSGQPEIVNQTVETSKRPATATTGAARHIQSFTSEFVMRQQQAPQHAIDPAGNGAR